MEKIKIDLTQSVGKGVKLNNLANLRGENVKWYGKTDFVGGFSKFDKPENSVRALVIDLKTKRSHGYNTVRKIITMFAPPTENDTNVYMNYVSKKTLLGLDTPILDNHVFEIASAILKMETKTNLSTKQVQEIYLQQERERLFGEKKK